MKSFPLDHPKPGMNYSLYTSAQDFMLTAVLFPCVGVHTGWLSYTSETVASSCLTTPRTRWEVPSSLGYPGERGGWAKNLSIRENPSSKVGKEGLVPTSV